MVASLALLDDDGEQVVLDREEAATLLGLTRGLEPATVSACPTCRSRIIAVVALVDLLDEAPPFIRSAELVELADDAPTLHLYVRDLETPCAHRAWRDPGYDEAAVSDYMKTPEITLKVALGLGKGRDRVLTCDLTKEYVAINGDYRS